MKTKLIKTVLFLIAVTSITGAQADESLAQRIKEVFQEPRNTHAPTSVAAVRG